MKMILINDCLQCPFWREDALDSVRGWCKKEKRWLPLSLMISDWCPLPNYTQGTLTGG